MTHTTPKEITVQRALTFFIFIAFLSGCASTSDQGSTQSVRQNKKIAACVAAARESEWLVVDVPAASSFIANKMVATTLSMGGSNTVDTLVKVLSQPTRSAVAVIGENDEVTAATLETALHNLPPGANRSAQPVCFVGDTNDAVRLRSSAERAGLHLLILSNS